jgi:excisionase family DNA binding protein
MTITDSDILTILEVARYLKVAERTVYRLAAAKKLPAFKVGGAWRFSRSDIDSWIRQQSAKAITESADQPRAAKTGLSRGERK